MNENTDPERIDAGDASPARAPYRKPVLTVYGPVASMTHTANMAGVNKDGGPNNSKS